MAGTKSRLSVADVLGEIMNNSGSEDLSDEDEEESVWSDAPDFIPSDPDADDSDVSDMDVENGKGLIVAETPNLW